MVELGYGGDDVVDGADVAEVLGLEFVAGLAFDLVEQIDGVDAVDFEVFVEVGAAGYVAGVDFGTC